MKVTVGREDSYEIDGIETIGAEQGVGTLSLEGVGTCRLSAESRPDVPSRQPTDAVRERKTAMVVAAAIYVTWLTTMIVAGLFG